MILHIYQQLLNGHKPDLVQWGMTWRTPVGRVIMALGEPEFFRRWMI